LLIAYGNPSRQDDGLAYHIVIALRNLLGLETIPLDELADGELRDGLQVCFTQQLVPEMAEMLSEMDIVIFIDAHVPGTGYQQVHWEEIQPLFQPSMVSHHFKPEVLVAWCSSLYGHTPQAFILSVLGTNYDFGTELSPETEARVHEAAHLLATQLELLPA
jgi:hydrogenase maturation protease